MRTARLAESGDTGALHHRGCCFIKLAPKKTGNRCYRSTGHPIHPNEESSRNRERGDCKNGKGFDDRYAEFQRANDFYRGIGLAGLRLRTE